MFMSPSSYLCAQGVAENNQFFDWKESDYKAYEVRFGDLHPLECVRSGRT